MKFKIISGKVHLYQ